MIIVCVPGLGNAVSTLFKVWRPTFRLLASRGLSVHGNLPVGSEWAVGAPGPDSKAYVEYVPGKYVPEPLMASTAEDVYGRLLTALRRHSGVITRGVASACAKQFEALLQRAPPPVLRVTYYPAQKGRTIANHQHSDIDLVTLLPRATTAGLQVLSAGEWREIDIAEDSFVVLGGEMLELMGGPTAEVHRVVGETERVSASFFVNASPDEYLPDGRLAGTVMEERLKMVRRDIPMSRL